MVRNLFSDNKPSKRAVWPIFGLCKNGFHRNGVSEDKRFYGQMNTPASMPNTVELWVSMRPGDQMLTS